MSQLQRAQPGASSATVVLDAAHVAPPLSEDVNASALAPEDLPAGSAVPEAAAAPERTAPPPAKRRAKPAAAAGGFDLKPPPSRAYTSYVTSLPDKSIRQLEMIAWGAQVTTTHNLNLSGTAPHTADSWFEMQGQNGGLLGYLPLPKDSGVEDAGQPAAPAAAPKKRAPRKRPAAKAPEAPEPAASVV